MNEEMMNGALSDDELDNVVGGTSIALVGQPYTSKFGGTAVDVRKIKYSGDLASFQKLLAGGSVTSLDFYTSAGQVSVPADRLDSYLSRLTGQGFEIVKL